MGGFLNLSVSEGIPRPGAKNDSPTKPSFGACGLRCAEGAMESNFMLRSSVVFTSEAGLFSGKAVPQKDMRWRKAMQKLPISQLHEIISHANLNAIDKSSVSGQKLKENKTSQIRGIDLLNIGYSCLLLPLSLGVARLLFGESSRSIGLFFSLNFGLGSPLPLCLLF